MNHVDFNPFVLPHDFAEYVSGGKWIAAKHLRYIGAQVADAISTPGGGRLVVNLPPRHGKSEFISFWTPTWWIELFPAKRVILATASGLARHYGGKVRDEFVGNPKLTTVLKEDTTAKNEWSTPAGGGMKSVTVNESVIGRGADLLIIDDPYGTWDDAWSRAYRKGVEDWFTATASSRLEPGATIIILHHRMHPNDLTDFVLTGPDKDRWKHVCLPSLAMPNDLLNRPVGQPLWPERYGLAELEQKRTAMRWAWEPMHQQNPQTAGAGLLYRAFAEKNLRTASIIKTDPIIVGVDFNINPGMHVEFAQHFSIRDEFVFFDEIHAPRMTLEQAARAIIAKYQEWPWKPEIQLFGDATGGSDSIRDGTSHWSILKRMLRESGINVRDRVPSVNPPIVDSVAAVNDALGHEGCSPRLFVDRKCERLLADFRQVCADDDGKPDKSDKELTHASDIVRYIVGRISPIRLSLKIPNETARF